MLGAGALALSSLGVGAAADTWGKAAPEVLPRVTVRWEDPGQSQVFVVEGERYSCRVGTHPARILSLSVDSESPIEGSWLQPGFRDEKGRLYVPAPADLVPNWKTWQGQGWKPAASSRARMNVWRAGPYYWEAHLVDVPFVPEAAVRQHDRAVAKSLVEWSFGGGVEGWEALNQCQEFGVQDGALRVTYEGNDPYFQGPPVDCTGPLAINMRLRAAGGGHVVVYWATEAKGYCAEQHTRLRVQDREDWQDVRLVLSTREKLTRIRLDPPGQQGWLELDSVRIDPLDASLHDIKPVRGEIVFHTFADRLNVEFRLETGDRGSVPATAEWTTGLRGGNEYPLGNRRACVLPDADDRAVAVLGATGADFGAEDGRWTTPLSGARPGTWWVMRVGSGGAPVEQLFRDELHPLPAGNVSVAQGHWLGYDPSSGLYLMESAMHGGGYGFNAAFDNPHRRMSVPVSVRAGGVPRRMVVKCASKTGILPATVLADRNGFMLPTPVLSCKNFAGEREEPDDSAFGDAFFPLALGANEERQFQVLHLFQSWGDHLVKQVSSIRFFQVYWHLSTGVSETTCFTIPSMLLNGEYVRIPDYRPYSGPFWVGQPQHDCLSWPGLLQYRSEGERVHLLYDRTVFRSITPNLSRFTMRFATSDGAARATVTAMEIPQRDETRTFLRLRYDWDRSVRIDGDARRSFRWLNVNDKKLPELLLWTDVSGTTQTKSASSEGDLLLGEVLARECPVVGSHGMPGSQGCREYHSFVLVRSFRARLGGEPCIEAAASATYGRKTGNYWLTCSTEDLTLVPGDFVEAELMLMPHAEPVEPSLRPERERTRFGLEPPMIDAVTIGRKVADFPATVEAEDEVAQFRISGGHNALPVVAKGFRHWGVPMLWEGTLWRDQQTHGGDGYQVDPDGDGRYRFTFVVPLRHGMTPMLTVTRAQCTAGIKAVRDVNGYPQIEAEAEGAFSLRAPVLFAPGENTIENGSPIIEFAGRGRSVRAVPVSVTPRDREAIVSVRSFEDGEASLEVRGAAVLCFEQLAVGGTYVVGVDGGAGERVAADGRIQLDLTAGRHTVALRRTIE